MVANSGAAAASISSAESTKAIWNPNAAVNWSLIFTPAFGSYLQMLNWRALGEPQKAASATTWFYVSFAMLAICLLVAVLTVRPFGALLSLLYLFVWYFASGRAQTKYVKQKFGFDYPRKAWGEVLLWAVAALVAYFLVAGIVITEEQSPTPGKQSSASEVPVVPVSVFASKESKDHRYVVKQGYRYGYEKAISEQEKFVGRATRSVRMISYTGNDNGVYQIIFDNEDTERLRIILGDPQPDLSFWPGIEENKLNITYAECSLPCEFVTLKSWERGPEETVRATKDSILWAALEDATQGKLERVVIRQSYQQADTRPDDRSYKDYYLRMRPGTVNGLLIPVPDPRRDRTATATISIPPVTNSTRMPQGEAKRQGKEGAKPTPEEVKKYFVEHPELFSKRRIYNLEEITFDAKEGLAASVREQIDETRSLHDLATWLISQGIQFQENRGVRAAEQIPLHLLPKIAAMKDGNVLVFEEGAKILVVHVLGSHDVPVDEAQASPAIQQFLINRQTTK